MVGTGVEEKGPRGSSVGIGPTGKKVQEVTNSRGQSSDHLWNFPASWAERFCGVFKPHHGHVVNRSEADMCDCLQSVTEPCNPRIWPYTVCFPQ